MWVENKLAKRYAQSLFALAADEKQVEDVYLVLKSICDAVWANQSMCKIACSSTSPQHNKEEFFNIIAANLTTMPLLQNFIQLLVQNNRVYLLKSIVAHYEHMLCEQRGELQVKLSSAIPFNATQEKSLLAELQNIYQKKIKLTMETDESLLAGFQLRLGSSLIDFSLSAKLRKLRKALLETQINTTINNV